MIEQPIVQLLVLLVAAVAVVAAFQRLNIPSTLGYLLVGVVLGPYTPGPVIEGHQLRVLAEFGIVFLLFTIGLNFSLPRIRALRNQVFALGSGQVLLTTAVVGGLAWIVGLPAAAAFVVGAVFAQSSTTVISRQLTEQGEDDTRHGRLGVAMSVFQDVTAVPFIVIIPALGVVAGADALAASLGWAVAKAALAFGIVFVAGRWLLRPLFHTIAESRSAELFTLTVLLVSLAAGWTTQRLGLSMAFGAFLAGMMLGETEFRHQVESAIRPFRDMLLGLFFVGIGMMFDLGVMPDIWPWAITGSFVLMGVKTVLVAGLVRLNGADMQTAWQTGLLLAVGGEFGFAVLAIAFSANAISGEAAQVALASVLLSIVFAPLLIRHNRAIARWLSPTRPAAEEQAPPGSSLASSNLSNHVIICGYGRIGQSVGHFLEEEEIGFVALDLDPLRVREAHLAGEPVYFGDATERGVLESVGIGSARLLVISHHDTPAALRLLQVVRDLRPGLPVMARTRDESHVDELREAGAVEVVPETLEAALMIAVHALLLLDVPLPRILRRMQEQRSDRYRLLREFIRGEVGFLDDAHVRSEDRLHPVLLSKKSTVVGRTLGDLALPGVTVTALVRDGERTLDPAADTRLEPGDVLVMFGSVADVQHAEELLAG